jgi:succinate dehydrogenase hydrophobic anchor subunit
MSVRACVRLTAILLQNVTAVSSILLCSVFVQMYIWQQGAVHDAPKEEIQKETLEHFYSFLTEAVGGAAEAGILH